jgi:hypothetical protein
MFIAAGISLPAASELVGTIPNIDPLLLHNVRSAILIPCFLRTSHRQGMLMAARQRPARKLMGSILSL